MNLSAVSTTEIDTRDRNRGGGGNRQASASGGLLVNVGRKGYGRNSGALNIPAR